MDFGNCGLLSLTGLTDVVMTSSGLDENDFKQHTGWVQHTMTETPEVGAEGSWRANTTAMDDIIVN
jgi:hypothetical protein